MKRKIVDALYIASFIMFIVAGIKLVSDTYVEETMDKNPIDPVAQLHLPGESYDDDWLNTPFPFPELPIGTDDDSLSAVRFTLPEGCTFLGLARNSEIDSEAQCLVGSEQVLCVFFEPPSEPFTPRMMCNH